MDNKITKKRVALHFEYDWLKYVLVLLASILIFYIVYWQINVTREFEKLDIYFSTYQNNSGTNLSDGFKQKLKEEGDDIIRKVNVSYQNPNSSSYPMTTTTNSYTSDVMILPEYYMESQAFNFIEFSDDILKDCIPEGMEVEKYVYPSTNEVYKEYHGKIYAIRIDNLKKIDNSINKENSPFIFDMTQIVSESEKENYAQSPTKFYMVINPNSVNIGKYGKDKDYRHLKHTFRFIRYFLETYNV